MIFRVVFCELLPRRVYVFHHPLLFICTQEHSSYYVCNTNIFLKFSSQNYYIFPSSNILTLEVFHNFFALSPKFHFCGPRLAIGVVFKFVSWYSNSSRGIQIRLVVGKFVLVVYKFVCLLRLIALDSIVGNYC